MAISGIWGANSSGSSGGNMNGFLQGVLNTLKQIENTMASISKHSKQVAPISPASKSGTNGTSMMPNTGGNVPTPPGGPGGGKPGSGGAGSMPDPNSINFGMMPRWMGVAGAVVKGVGLAGLGMAAIGAAAMPSAGEAMAMQGMLHQMGTRQNSYNGRITQDSILGNIRGSMGQYLVGGRDQAMMAGMTISNAGIQNQAMMGTLLGQNQGLALMTGLTNQAVAQAQVGFSNGPMAARMLSFGMPTADIGTGSMKNTQQILETMYQRMRRPGFATSPEKVQESYYRGSLGANFRYLGLSDEQQQIALQYFTERSRSKGPVNLSDINGLKTLGYNEDNADWMSQAGLDSSKFDVMTKTFKGLSEGAKIANHHLKNFYDTIAGMPEDKLNTLAKATGYMQTIMSDPAAAEAIGVLTTALKGLLGVFSLLAASPLIKMFGGGSTGGAPGGGVPGSKPTPVTKLGATQGPSSPWSPGGTPGQSRFKFSPKFKSGGGVWGTIAATVAATVGVQFLPDWMTGKNNAFGGGETADLSKMSDEQLRQMGMNEDDIRLVRQTASVSPGGNDQSYTYAMDKLANKMEGLLGQSSAFGHSVYHRCLGNVQDAWSAIGGTNKTRWGTAASAAASMRERGILNKGPAPRGALLLWNSSIGGGAGHIAVADGKGHAVNNWGGNTIERTPLSQMKKGYMGWAYPHEGLGKNPGDVKKGWLQGTGPEGGKAGGATGQAIADYAMKFVGTPYRAGGRDPKKGWDCAGFTWYVAKHFGITLATTAGGQLKNGSPIPLKQARAGDLIIYAKKNSRGMNNDGHVAISLGGGRVVHAGRSGTKVTSVQGAAPGMQIVGVRRIAGGGMGTGSALTSSVGFATAEMGSPGGYVNVEVDSSGMSVSASTIADTLGGSASGGAVSVASGSMGLMAGSSGSDGATGGQVSGKGNRAKVWNMLMGQGFSQAAAAGIIGNLMQESGVDPNSNQGGGGPGRGIMQWTVNERWASMQSWAKKRNMNTRDLDTQVQWMLKEMKDYGVLKKMKGMNDVERATLYFENTMERAGVPNMDARYKYAREALRQFGRGSYSAGAYNLPSDEDARVHAGEMIVPADKAQEVRHAMAGVMAGQKGGGHTFNIYVPPGTTEEQANLIARRVATILDRKSSTKSLMES